MTSQSVTDAEQQANAIIGEYFWRDAKTAPFIIESERGMLRDAIAFAIAAAENDAYERAERVCRERVNQNDARLAKYISGSPEFHAWGNRSDEAEECADAIKRLAAAHAPSGGETK